jgi:hypothetical protein
MTTEDLELPDSGETIAVRGLTGLEVALIGKRNAQLVDDPDSPGGIAIQVGLMLGRTKIRDAEAAGLEWLANHSGRDFTTVGDRIEALSGFGKGAQKSPVDRATDNG